MCVWPVLAHYIMLQDSMRDIVLEKARKVEADRQ